MVKNKKPSKKSLIIATLIVGLLAVLLGVYLIKRPKLSQPTPTTPDVSSAKEVNLQPPTANDAQRTDENKQKNIERDQALNSQPSSSGKKTVSPTITDAGQYGSAVEVSGYVSGIFEDGGTCTATFIQGSNKVTKSVSAFKNANSVNCPTISTPTSEFTTKGTWSVTLTYDSTDAAGSSNSKTIEVK